MLGMPRSLPSEHGTDRNGDSRAGLSGLVGGGWALGLQRRGRRAATAWTKVSPQSPFVTSASPRLGRLQRTLEPPRTFLARASAPLISTCQLADCRAQLRSADNRRPT